MATGSYSDTFGGGGWQNYGAYLAQKSTRIGEQLRERHGSETTGDPLPLEGAGLFAGCVFWLDGRTRIPENQLKRLMVRYGGEYESYNLSKVTHVVADNLALGNKKWQHIRDKGSKRFHVVTSEWILACIERKSRIKETYFVPTALQVRGDGFGTMLQYVDAKPSDMVGNSKEQILIEAQDKTDTVNEETESGTERADDECRAPMTKESADWSPSGFPPPSQGSVNALSSREHLLKKPHKIAVLGTDDEMSFVENFFKSSRLHFIGRWRERLLKKIKISPFVPLSVLVTTGKLDNVSVAEGSLKRFLLPTEKAQRVERRKETPSQILHIDFDAFFVSVAVRKRPDLRSQPVAVSHGSTTSSASEIASCNYVARNFGVTKGMWMGTAVALCPNLVTLPYDFEGIEETSNELMEVLTSVTTRVLPMSCDEVSKKAQIEPRFLFQAYIQLVGEEEISRAQGVAKWIKETVMKRTGCRVSIGVGDNLLLAKMAGQKAKPSDSTYGEVGVFQVQGSNRDFMRSVKLADLPSVGTRALEKFSEIGMKSCKDVTERSNLAQVQQILGKKAGEQVWGFCHGLDSRPFPNPQMGVGDTDRTCTVSVNWGVRLTTQTGMSNFLKQMAQECERRLIAAQGTVGDITLKILRRAANAPVETIKFGGCGECDELTKRLVMSHPMSKCDEIHLHLLKLWHTGMASDCKIPDVRGVSVVMSKLKKIDNKKLSPFSSDQKMKSATEIIPIGQGNVIVPSPISTAYASNVGDVVDFQNTTSATSVDPDSRQSNPSEDDVDIKLLDQLIPTTQPANLPSLVNAEDCSIKKVKKQNEVDLRSDSDSDSDSQSTSSFSDEYSYEECPQLSLCRATTSICIPPQISSAKVPPDKEQLDLSNQTTITTSRTALDDCSTLSSQVSLSSSTPRSIHRGKRSRTLSFCQPDASEATPCHQSKRRVLEASNLHAPMDTPAEVSAKSILDGTCELLSELPMSKLTVSTNSLNPLASRTANDKSPPKANNQKKHTSPNKAKAVASRKQGGKATAKVKAASKKGSAKSIRPEGKGLLRFLNKLPTTTEGSMKAKKAETIDIIDLSDDDRDPFSEQSNVQQNADTVDGFNQSSPTRESLSENPSPDLPLNSIAVDLSHNIQHSNQQSQHHTTTSPKTPHHEVQTSRMFLDDEKVSHFPVMLDENFIKSALSQLEMDFTSPATFIRISYKMKEKVFESLPFEESPFNKIDAPESVTVQAGCDQSDSGESVDSSYSYVMLTLTHHPPIYVGARQNSASLDLGRNDENHQEKSSHQDDNLYGDHEDCFIHLDGNHEGECLVPVDHQSGLSELDLLMENILVDDNVLTNPKSLNDQTHLFQLSVDDITVSIFDRISKWHVDDAIEETIQPLAHPSNFRLTSVWKSFSHSICLPTESEWTLTCIFDKLQPKVKLWVSLLQKNCWICTAKSILLNMSRSADVEKIAIIQSFSAALFLSCRVCALWNWICKAQVTNQLQSALVNNCEVWQQCRKLMIQHVSGCYLCLMLRRDFDLADRFLKDLDLLWENISQIKKCIRRSFVNETQLLVVRAEVTQEACWTCVVRQVLDKNFDVGQLPVSFLRDLHTVIKQISSSRV